MNRVKYKLYCYVRRLFNRTPFDKRVKRRAWLERKIIKKKKNKQCPAKFEISYRCELEGRKRRKTLLQNWRGRILPEKDPTSSKWARLYLKKKKIRDKLTKKKKKKRRIKVQKSVNSRNSFSRQSLRTFVCLSFNRVARSPAIRLISYLQKKIRGTYKKIYRFHSRKSQWVARKEERKASSSPPLMRFHDDIPYVTINIYIYNIYICIMYTYVYSAYLESSSS